MLNECVHLLCFPPSAPQAPAHPHVGVFWGKTAWSDTALPDALGPNRHQPREHLHPSGFSWGEAGPPLFYAMRYAMFRDMVPEYVIPKMLNQSAANPIADPIPTVTVLFVLIADFNQYTRTMVHKVLNMHNPTWCPSKGKQEELLETQVAQTCFRHRTLVCPRGQLRS